MTKEQQALKAFVDAIDATGGVRRQSDGCYVPVADEDWIDLGDAYLDACIALDRKPIVVDDVCECGRLEDDCSFDGDDPESQHGDLS